MSSRPVKIVDLDQNKKSKLNWIQSQNNENSQSNINDCENTAAFWTEKGQAIRSSSRRQTNKKNRNSFMIAEKSPKRAPSTKSTSRTRREISDRTRESVRCHIARISGGLGFDIWETTNSPSRETTRKGTNVGDPRLSIRPSRPKGKTSKLRLRQGKKTSQLQTAKLDEDQGNGKSRASTIIKFNRKARRNRAVVEDDEGGAQMGRGKGDLVDEANSTKVKDLRSTSLSESAESYSPDLDWKISPSSSTGSSNNDTEPKGNAVLVQSKAVDDEPKYGKQIGMCNESPFDRKESFTAILARANVIELEDGITTQRKGCRGKSVRDDAKIKDEASTDSGNKDGITIQKKASTKQVTSPAVSKTSDTSSSSHTGQYSLGDLSGDSDGSSTSTMSFDQAVAVICAPNFRSQSQIHPRSSEPERVPMKTTGNTGTNESTGQTTERSKSAGLELRGSGNEKSRVVNRTRSMPSEKASQRKVKRELSGQDAIGKSDQDRGRTTEQEKSSRAFQRSRETTANDKSDVRSSSQKEQDDNKQSRGRKHSHGPGKEDKSEESNESQMLSNSSMRRKSSVRFKLPPREYTDSDTSYVSRSLSSDRSVISDGYQPSSSASSIVSEVADPYGIEYVPPGQGSESPYESSDTEMPLAAIPRAQPFITQTQSGSKTTNKTSSQNVKKRLSGQVNQSRSKEATKKSFTNLAHCKSAELNQVDLRKVPPRFMMYATPVSSHPKSESELMRNNRKKPKAPGTATRTRRSSAKAEKEQKNVVQSSHGITKARPVPKEVHRDAKQGYRKDINVVVIKIPGMDVEKQEVHEQRVDDRRDGDRNSLKKRSSTSQANQPAIRADRKKSRDLQNKSHHGTQPLNDDKKSKSRMDQRLYDKHGKHTGNGHCILQHV